MTPSKKISFEEDWVIVFLGFLIIGLAVSGFVVPVPTFSWKDTSDLANSVFSSTNLTRIFFQFLFVYVFAIAASWLTGKSVRSAVIVFPLVAILTVLALILAGNAQIKGLNLEAVIFSLTLGLLVSNVFTLPPRIREALTAELFVKIGLVLLGASVIFGDILKAGSLGLVQALIVVVAVWYFAFWLCRKLKIDEELSVMISSAVSICGVSAAIATAGGI